MTLIADYMVLKKLTGV